MHDVLIAHDLAYADVSYDGYVPPSILEVDGARDVAIEFNSLSKTFNMTGWRVGMAVGNETVIDALKRVKSNLDSGIPQAVQRMAITALDGPLDAVTAHNETYRRRRDRAVEVLRSLGLRVDPPQASLYVWARLPDAERSSAAYAQRLVEQTGVVVTPGLSYGEGGGALHPHLAHAGRRSAGDGTRAAGEVRARRTGAVALEGNRGDIAPSPVPPAPRFDTIIGNDSQEAPFPRKRPHQDSSDGDHRASNARRRHGRMVATAPRQERAYLVSLDHGQNGVMTADESMRELARLARTAGATVVGQAFQRRDRPSPGTYIGSGKLEQVKAAREESDYSLVIFDEQLAPAQQLHLESALSSEAHPVKVLDRSASSSISSPAARAPARLRCRSSWRSTSTCCRACEGSGSTWSAWRVRSAPAVPARRSWRPTAA